MAKALQVILQRDVPKLGKGGEVVKVSPGYARNYLLPQGFALPASAGNIQHFEHQKRVASERAAKLRSDATSLAGRLGAVELTLTRAVGPEGRLYGSVTTKDIEAALKTKGFDVDRRKLAADAIRTLGTFDVSAKLAPEVSATFKVHVVASTENKA